MVVGVKLLRCGIFVCAASSVSVCVGVAIPQVNEFEFMAYSGNKDVVGFEV